MNYSFSRLAFGLLSLLPAAGMFSPAAAQQVEVTEERNRPAIVREAPERDYSPATVERVTGIETVPDDFWVYGNIDAVRLINDLAYVAIGALPDDEQDEDQLNIRHGGLVDLTLSSSAPENFHAFTPNTAAGNELFVRNTSVRFEEEANGQASVTVLGEDVRYPDLTVSTEYLMQRDMPGVLVTTTFTNTSDDVTAEGIQPTDFVLWGAMEPFLPGLGYTRSGVAVDDAEFIFARAHDVWAMVAPETGTMDINHFTEFSQLQYAEPSDMLPGETRIYRRWVLVSDYDAAYLFSRVLEQRPGASIGTLAGRVIERTTAPDGSLMDRGPVLNTDIYITPLARPEWTAEQREQYTNVPYLIAESRQNGSFNAILPTGDYRVFPAPRDRIAPMPNYVTEIREGELAAQEFGVSPPSRLIYSIVDAATGERMPGKLTIEPLRGTRPVELGFPGAVRAGNTVLSSHGAGIVELPPGNYRVTASRGPEYHTVEHRISIREIADTEQVFAVERAYETPGWVSADIGVRTEASAQSRVSPESRVVSAVAEGVEWLVTGDENTATDLSPAVEALGLGRWLTTSPGYRHPGGSAPFRGDFLLFPADICSVGGEPDFSPVRRANSTREILSAMRALCPEAAILLNRATWPGVGYLTLQGYEARDRVLPPGDWPKDFDAFTVWEGKRQPTVESDYRAYHRLLNSGLRLAAFGGSFSTGTWLKEAGYPRVYIKSSTDDPARIDPEEMAANIKDRLVSVTNGPFVDVKVNDKPMGSLVTDTDGQVQVDIEVYSPNWARVNSVSVNLNGLFVRRILTNPSLQDPKAGKVFPPADDLEKGTLSIRVERDSVLDIVVEGSLDIPMDPVNPMFSNNAYLRVPEGQFPMAISAPIFIDADGDARITPRTDEELREETDEDATDDPPF